MANDKHRVARAARERFNAELFDKWLKANGYTGKDAEATAQLTPGGVIIIPDDISPGVPMPEVKGRRKGTTETGRVRGSRRTPEAGRKDGEVPPPREAPRPYPQRYELIVTRYPFGRVIYSDGSAVELTADVWDLAEARFTEGELAAHKTPGQDVCCCFGTEAENDCGIVHGTCTKTATVNVTHNAFDRRNGTGEDQRFRANLFPTCTECASAFVKRLGTPLILDFLDHPPMFETFVYLLKLKKEREE